MPEFKFHVPLSEAHKVLSWVKDGRGVKVWKSHDIGAGRPDQLTPGDSKPPHWAYPESTPIELSEIGVFDRTPVVPPPDWQPLCAQCKGVGYRTYADVAAIRQESVEECKAALTKPGSAWADRQRDEHSFTCNSCDGTGHQRFTMYIKLKWMYYGAWVPAGNALPAKVGKMLERLTKHYGIKRGDLKWDFELVDHNEGQVFFFTEKEIPFPEFMDREK